MLQLRAGGAKSYIAGEGVSVTQPLGDALIFDFRDDFTVASFSFADDFNRADGAIGNGWNGATWTISGNKAINTPTLGSEQLTDPGLEAWLSATDPTNWSEGIAGTSTVNREASVIHGGSFAARLDIDASTSIAQITQVVNSAVVGQWVRRSAWAKSNPVSKTATLATLNVFPTNEYSYTLTGTYAQIVETRRVTAANPQMSPKRAGGSASSSLYFDDVSWKVLTLSTLFVSQNFNLNDVYATVKATLAAGNPAGLVLNLDSASSPANFVLAYHDGTNAYLDKCVAGTYTNLITAAATYSAGAILRVSKLGNTYKLYYNSVQIGADQTVNDAGIVSNTIHGQFSTYEGNSLDDFSVSAPLTSPRQADPGPGQWTISDANSKMSVSGGRLVIATPNIANNPVAAGTSLARIIGRASLSINRSTAVYLVTGFSSLPLGNANTHVMGFLAPTGVIVFDNTAAITVGETVLSSTDYAGVVILRSTGCLFIFKDITNNSIWKVAWIGVAGTLSPLYPNITLPNNNSGGTVDTYRVLPLPAPFDTDFGLVTDRKATGVTTGTTYVHEANCIIEHTITTLSINNSAFFFRQQDASNGLIVTAHANGDLALYERIGNVDTRRGLSLASAASGYRVVIVCDGSTIRVYSNNVLRITYSTVNFATATAGSVLSVGGGGALSNIVSWPRQLPLAAAALLDEALAA
jgi:hypothetical protein